MYIENKGGEWRSDKFGNELLSGGNLTGPARIGRVTFSKTMRSLTYGGMTFQRAEGFKSNYFCVETGEEYWISGPKKRGGDALYATNVTTAIDDDVRVEYWVEVRKQPERVNEKTTL
jgi:hypothetical protein